MRRIGIYIPGPVVAIGISMATVSVRLKLSKIISRWARYPLRSEISVEENLFN